MPGLEHACMKIDRIPPRSSVVVRHQYVVAYGLKMMIASIAIPIAFH